MFLLCAVEPAKTGFLFPGFEKSCGARMSKKRTHKEYPSLQGSVVAPLEDLLPRLLQGGDLTIPHYEFFCAKFSHGRPKRQGDPFLNLHLLFTDSHLHRTIPIYETSELDTILLVEVKEPDKIE